MSAVENWSLVVLVVGVLLLTAGGMPGAARERVRTARRLAAIERTLDAVAAHLGVTVTEPELPEVMLLLEEGKQIAAVKAYREATGADLLTAKNAVDELARRR
jgi:ribosomal protein L7/L12